HLHPIPTIHLTHAAKTRNPTLIASTTKHHLVTLRVALNVAVKADLVARNVASLVDPPKVTRPELRVFAPEEARAFIEALKGERLQAVFATSIALGYRQGEAPGLRWPDGRDDLRPSRPPLPAGRRASNC